MRRDRSHLVEEALLRLQQGESLEQCLAHYPDDAKQLEPLLRVAQGLHQLADVSLPVEMDAWLTTGRDAFEQEVRRTLGSPQSPTPLSRLVRFLRAWYTYLFVIFRRRTLAAVSICLVVVSLFFPLVEVAAAPSLPGEALYSIKLTSETLRLALTFNAEHRADLYVEYANRRVSEMSRIAENPDEEASKQLTYTVHLLVIQIQGAIDESLRVGTTVQVQQALASLLVEADQALNQVIDTKPANLSDRQTLQVADQVVASLQETLPHTPARAVVTPIVRLLSPQPTVAPSATPTVVITEAHVVDPPSTPLPVPSELPSEIAPPMAENGSHTNPPQPRPTALPPPTPSPSMVPSVTAIPTSTQLPTATPTVPRPTATPTEIPIPSLFPTPVSTAQRATFTPIPTETASPQPTATETPLPTYTSVVAISPVPTVTSTIMPSPTVTATSGLTLTATVTNEPTPTVTATAEISPTVTATNEPTPTVTATGEIIPTVTVTTEISPTVTVTVTTEISPNPTADSSPTPTETPTVSSSPTPTETPTVSSSPTPTETPTATGETVPTATTTSEIPLTATQTATSEIPSTETSTPDISPTRTFVEPPTAIPTATPTTVPATKERESL